MSRRVVFVWFPRLASERVLRQRPVTGPFALIGRDEATERITCLNDNAEASGLARGMAEAEARALCPGLQTATAEPAADAAFLTALRRWADRYSPLVGRDGDDGLVLDITGVAHLFGSEAALLDDLSVRLAGAGMTAHVGLADTARAARALAYGGGGVAAPGRTMATIGPLPLATLGLEAETCQALRRLGLRIIRDLTQVPRASLARRFGQDLLSRLDQALGDQPAPVGPERVVPHYGVRLSLPEPIGLTEDVTAGLRRLLERLCEQLDTHQTGARSLRLELRRVDASEAVAEIGLARPMRDPDAMARLFGQAIDDIEAGFGIDRLRLTATDVEPLPARQLSTSQTYESGGKLADLITRLGNRVGFENIIRYLPAESHIPERSFLTAQAAWSEPATEWPGSGPERPLLIFPPEAVAATGAEPPHQFRWRRMDFTTARVTGPERIAPEWWFDDPAWRTGLRDYWKVETAEGRRLWLFHTPQNPGWFVQGEFP